MKQNKLGDYLKSFTDYDWSAYHKFSKALYSEKSDYQLVINYIKKHKKRYDPTYMDVEYLRNKIRPTANKQVFSNVISNLCKHVEKYLIYAEIEKDDMMQDTLLMQANAKRGLTSQFYKQKAKAKMNRAANPTGLWHHYHDFLAEYLLYYCNMTADISVSKAALDEAHCQLGNFHSVMNDYLEVEMHNRRVLLKEEWPVPPFAEIENLPETNITQKIFKYLACLKYTRDIKYYKSLKEILREGKVSQELLYTIIIHLTSFLNIVLVQGKKGLTSELLEMYNYGIENNILFPNGKIPLLRYLNIIVLACGMKETAWANTFVEKYSNLVGKELALSAKKLGTAHIDFHSGNFENAIVLLRDIRFKDFDFEIRAKWLLLSSHYELNKDDFDTVEYYINSFILFVKRNEAKTPTLAIVSNLKSANYLKKIAKSMDALKIFDELKNESHLLYRKWLIQKVKEKID